MRSPMTARRARLFALVISLVLVTSACDHWETLGYGAARTSSNPFESHLRVDNVGQLQEKWSADAGGTTPPIVSGDTVFVAGPDLRAYSANGTTGCTGTPRVCEPLWTAAGPFIGSPTIAGNVIYAVSNSGLFAYDGRGTTNCGGAPKTCLPLWTAAFDAFASSVGSPAVANGVVFVDADKLYAFDAAGVTGCSGSPKSCHALWTAPGAPGATPAVAAGVVYVADVAENGQLRAFDAGGVTGCSGHPKTCAPLWTSPSRGGGAFLSGPPSIAGGRVYVLETHLGNCCPAVYETDLLQFDTAGHLLSSTDASVPEGTPPIPRGPVAIANGTAYAVNLGLRAFAATGAPTLLWTSKVDVSVGDDAVSSASVANGVVYALGLRRTGNEFRALPLAYDASGQVGCSGTPKVCSPLWIGPPGPPTTNVFQALDSVEFGPSVAQGTVFVRTDRLRAYTLP